jgi:two-component system chemotaxis response regulator CheY
MKIVIADDSEVIRIIIEKGIKLIGYDALHANNGHKVLELLEKNTKEIAMVLLDWNMPGLNGFEVLKAMKEDDRFSSIPVLMVSTESEESKISKVYEAGAAGYLAKPFEADELNKLIEKTLS